MAITCKCSQINGNTEKDQDNRGKVGVNEARKPSNNQDNNLDFSTELIR